MDSQTLFLLVGGGLFAFLLARMFLGKVAPDQARALVKSGARLVDVRSAAEHATGHIAGSVNVPLDQLASRLGELGDPTRPVVVYCASGVRSASAASLLKRAGFAAVHDLGGMARWGA